MDSRLQRQNIRKTNLKNLSFNFSISRYFAVNIKETLSRQRLGTNVKDELSAINSAIDRIPQLSTRIGLKLISFTLRIRSSILLVFAVFRPFLVETLRIILAIRYNRRILLSENKKTSLSFVDAANSTEFYVPNLHSKTNPRSSK